MIVSSDKHAGVGDDDVLEAAHDGGGEGGVVVGAENDGEHQNESKDTGKEELSEKQSVIPAFKL